MLHGHADRRSHAHGRLAESAGAARFSGAAECTAQGTANRAAASGPRQEDQEGREPRADRQRRKVHRLEIAGPRMPISSKIFQKTPDFHNRGSFFALFVPHFLDRSPATLIDPKTTPSTSLTSRREIIWCVATAQRFWRKTAPRPRRCIVPNANR